MIIFQLPQEVFKPFFKNKVLRLNLLLGLVFNVAAWGVLFWQIKEFPQLMPLHYNIYFGIDYYGPWHQVFLLPAIGLIVLFLNFFVSLFVINKEKSLAYFLLGGSTLVQFLLLLAATSLVMINL